MRSTGLAILGVHWHSIQREVQRAEADPSRPGRYFWIGVSGLIGRTTPFFTFVAVVLEIFIHGKAWLVSARKKNWEFVATSLNLGAGGGLAGWAAGLLAPPAPGGWLPFGATAPLAAGAG